MIKKETNIKIILNILDFFFNPLSHSATQKFLLVHVFLASILCLLHFTNANYKNKNIFFDSVIKRKFYISIEPMVVLLPRFHCSGLRTQRNSSCCRQCLFFDFGIKFGISVCFHNVNFEIAVFVFHNYYTIKT